MQQSASLPARAAAYVAAALALVYAMVSLYWALGGHALLSTVGGSIADLARRGGAPAIALGVTVVVLKLLAHSWPWLWFSRQAGLLAVW